MAAERLLTDRSPRSAVVPGSWTARYRRWSLGASEPGGAAGGAAACQAEPSRAAVISRPLMMLSKLQNWSIGNPKADQSIFHCSLPLRWESGCTPGGSPAPPRDTATRIGLVVVLWAGWTWSEYRWSTLWPVISTRLLHFDRLIRSWCHLRSLVSVSLLYRQVWVGLWCNMTLTEAHFVWFWRLV